MRRIFISSVVEAKRMTQKLWGHWQLWVDKGATVYSLASKSSPITGRFSK